jgi:drug/metabolite transporter (DMT)-like permease
MNDRAHPHTFPAHLFGLLAGLTLGWGFNWPVMKVVLSEMPPMHFRTVCLVCGALGLFAIARAAGQGLRVPDGQWPRMIAIGLVNMAGWNILVVYGIRVMASGRAAILGYTMPVWGVMLSTWLLNEPFTRRRAVGVALGFSGMVLLLANELSAVGDAPLGSLLVIGGAVSWALGTVIMKRWPVHLPTTAFTAWQMLIAVIPILAIALFWEHGSFSPFALSVWPMLGTFYNVFVAFIFCYWAWMKIALVAPVGVSSLAVMMTPVTGVFSGMLLLGETPHWYDYSALILVVASLSTVLIPSRAGRQTPPGGRPAAPPGPASSSG